MPHTKVIDLEHITQTLKKLIAKTNIAQLRILCDSLQSPDLADCLAGLNNIELVTCLRFLTIDKVADIFTYLDSDDQQVIVKAFTDEETLNFIKELDIDEIVDAIDELPSNLVKKILQASTPGQRQQINHLLRYDEETAGSIMSVDFLELKAKWTVKEAIAFVRNNVDQYQTTELFYVIDNNRLLLGYIYLKDLFFSQPGLKLNNICDKNLISILTNEDQEEVAYKFARYDMDVLPVLNYQKRLVGIITSEDVIDVIQQEATEDIQKLAGIAPTEETYFKISVLKMVRARSTWLLFLMISATVSQLVIQSFMSVYGVINDTNHVVGGITYIVTGLLIPLLPLVSGTSGNAGSQSSTMIVRALSLKEVGLKDYWRVLWKEFQVALITGLILVVVNFIRMIIIYFAEAPHTMNLDKWKAISVLSIALYLTLIIAKLVGSLLPIAAKLVKLDPAIMAAPLLTTLVDALSTAIFFSVGIIFFL